jgi:hypothetical protein
MITLLDTEKGYREIEHPSTKIVIIIPQKIRYGRNVP